MDWDNYHRLNVIHNFMDDLEYNYPSICTVGFIGTSLEGRDLKVKIIITWVLIYYNLCASG